MVCIEKPRCDTNGVGEYEVTVTSERHAQWKIGLTGDWFVWHGISFEEPNPTGSSPSVLIGLYKQHTKPRPPNTQGRARRKHGGDQGHPEKAESQTEEAEIGRRTRTGGGTKRKRPRKL